LGSDPFIGILYHWIGGLASASNFIPFRGIRRWSWEIYWIVQGVAAWIIAPSLIAWLLVPHFLSVIAAAPHRSVGFAALFGVLWGVGGLTFGLSIRYLGIALGYAVSLGLCTVFGTLIPPIYAGQMHAILHETSGKVILLGILVCLLAVGVNGFAGWSKEHEITEERKAETGEADFSLGRGLLVAIFAGIMSAFFAFGLAAGAPIASVAKERLLAEGRLDLWQNLPVLVVVLWGGFVTNVVWSVVLIVRNRSVNQFAGAAGVNPMEAHQIVPEEIGRRLDGALLARNYLFAALAGVVWYFQFFFYSLGQTKMGKYDFSSWTLHMASIIIFATLWGIFLKEWNGTTRRTKTLVGLGLSLLIGSTLIVGYGNYLKSIS
jgi:L-rhamnose-H+ transport protein